MHHPDRNSARQDDLVGGEPIEHSQQLTPVRWWLAGDQCAERQTQVVTPPPVTDHHSDLIALIRPHDDEALDRQRQVGPEPDSVAVQLRESP